MVLCMGKWVLYIVVNLSMGYFLIIKVFNAQGINESYNKERPPLTQVVHHFAENADLHEG